MKTIKKHWLVGVLAALGIGGLVGVSTARSVVSEETALEFPALDRAIAQLVAESRR